MIPSLEGWPAKAKEAQSPHEVKTDPTSHQPSTSMSLGILSESILGPKLKKQTVNQLEITESIYCFYGYLPMCKKSDHNSIQSWYIAYLKLHAQVYLTTFIWMDWIIQMYLCMPNYMHKIKFTPNFISAI